MLLDSTMIHPNKNDTVVKKSNGSHYRVVTKICSASPSASRTERMDKTHYVLELIYRREGEQAHVNVQQRDLNKSSYQTLEEYNAQKTGG